MTGIRRLLVSSEFEELISPRLPHFYRTCGLNIASDLALPSLLDSDHHEAPLDATIVGGSVPEALDEPLVGEAPNWELSATQFLLKMPDVGSIWICDGSRITYAPAPGQPAAALSAFLTGSVLGVLLHLRGALLLHGSAIRVGEGAVIFCGPSGAGKSTISAALGRRGYPMLCDDLAPLVDDFERGMLLYPDGRRHKLWDDAVNALALEGRRGEVVPTQLHKFHVEPVATISEPLPLLAIYELHKNESDDAVSIRRASLVVSAAIVSRNAYRPRMMWRLGQSASYFSGSTRIMRTGGIFELIRPMAFDRLDEVLDKLETQWGDPTFPKRGKVA
ncbi:MAG: hypothetical protein P8Y48_13950 [Novosphingobium sp.]